VEFAIFAAGGGAQEHGTIVAKAGAGARGWVFTAATYCHFNPGFLGVFAGGRPKKAENHIPVAKVGLTEPSNPFKTAKNSNSSLYPNCLSSLISEIIARI